MTVASPSPSCRRAVQPSVSGEAPPGQYMASFT
jgi:hypothetical protein